MIEHRWKAGDIDVSVERGIVILEDYDDQQVVFTTREFERFLAIAPQVLAAARDDPGPVSVNPDFRPIDADEVIRKGAE